MALEDLKRMVAMAEEAEQLLRRKHEVENEIQKAEKRLGKLQSELDAKEQAIAQADSQYKDIEGRFQHEKRRFSGDLEAHRLQCEDVKKALTKSVSDMRSESAKELGLLSDMHEKEKTRIARETAEHKGLLDTVKLEISDLKRRIAALG